VPCHWTSLWIMTLYVGTSGWAYREWKPDFYPQDLPQSRFLDHYGSVLSACEVNATFYRLQSEETFARWAEATPDSFRYSAKAHRRITHTRRMAPNEDGKSFIATFLKSLAPLGHRLGTVLLQYPPTRSRDGGALLSVLDSLVETISYAFEFRHDSWAAPEVTSILERAGATVCLASTTGDVPEALPSGPFAYVRLRAERYTEEQRAGWLDLLTREAAERDVYAFTKHEGIPAGDPYGGIGLAQWLRRETMS
jgi:uncharacterized protein YecE (DUF72 family)